MRRAFLVAVLLAAVVGCGHDRPSTDLISFNYCGNVCAGGTDKGAAFVSHLVADHRAKVVALQEICRSQAEALRSSLARTWGHADLAYETTFHQDFNGANRCQDDDYGIALIAPRIIRSSVTPLPNPGLGKRQLDERKILCADVLAFMACTTHVVRRVNDPQAHAEQISALRSFLDQRKSSRLVLAGDINEPNTLDVAGYTTGHHRLDHAYASHAVADELTTQTASCDCSDHRALMVHLRHA